MGMADPFAGMRCWCTICDSSVYRFDEWRCRKCDAVEKINALAEECSSNQYRRAWRLNPSLPREVQYAYINCADIIMEAENDFF